MFQNVNFRGSELYDCSFTKVVLDNCNFGKTILNYFVIAESKFLKCNLVELETLECKFKYPEFWKYVIESLKIVNNKDLYFKKIICNVNIGSIVEPIFVENQEAIKHFESRFTID